MNCHRISFQTTILLIDVFGNCLANENYEKMKDREILAPLNKDVEKINDDIVAKLP